MLIQISSSSLSPLLSGAHRGCWVLVGSTGIISCSITFTAFVISDYGRCPNIKGFWEVKIRNKLYLPLKGGHILCLLLYSKNNSLIWPEQCCPPRLSNELCCCVGLFVETHQPVCLFYQLCNHSANNSPQLSSAPLRHAPCLPIGDPVRPNKEIP